MKSRYNQLVYFLIFNLTFVLFANCNSIKKKEGVQTNLHSNANKAQDNEKMLGDNKMSKVELNTRISKKSENDDIDDETYQNKRVDKQVIKNSSNEMKMKSAATHNKDKKIEKDEIDDDVYPNKADLKEVGLKAYLNTINSKPILNNKVSAVNMNWSKKNVENKKDEVNLKDERLNTKFDMNNIRPVLNNLPAQETKPVVNNKNNAHSVNKMDTVTSVKNERIVEKNHNDDEEVDDEISSKKDGNKKVISQTTGPLVNNKLNSDSNKIAIAVKNKKDNEEINSNKQKEVTVNSLSDKVTTQNKVQVTNEKIIEKVKIAHDNKLIKNTISSPKIVENKIKNDANIHNHKEGRLNMNLNKKNTVKVNANNNKVAVNVKAITNNSAGNVDAMTSQSKVYPVYNKNKQKISFTPNQTILPPNVIKYEPVVYVKQLSPAGKAALEAQESGDYEYQALLNNGFETPRMVSSVINSYETNIQSPKKVSHLWNHMAPTSDQSLWQNVELHKFGNNMMETHKYNTPAKFVMDKYGDTIVHAPSDSSMRIIKRTPTITSYSFLEEEEDN